MIVLYPHVAANVSKRHANATTLGGNIPSTATILVEYVVHPLAKVCVLREESKK